MVYEDCEDYGVGRRGRKKRSNKTVKVVKEKFIEEREGLIKPITAKNENQKKYLDSLQKNTLTVGKGSAGTGKSYLAASVAANKYLRGEVDTIVVTRPIVGMGRSTGFWPGTMEQKIQPYVQPILNTIKKRIGNQRFESEFGKSIVIQPMESIRGMSFEPKTYLLVDEAQNMTPEEIRSVVTRTEEGAYLAFCGDDKQKDIPGVSGIVYLADLIKNNDIPSCGVVEFSFEDIVRSGLTRKFVEIFETEGAVSQVEKKYKGI
ncbi:MAG: PhoH family protein [Gammaproteobacteria bacterium]|nr:PhoH family protein [Gammaproteobacteria bacterium]